MIIIKFKKPNAEYEQASLDYSEAVETEIMTFLAYCVDSANLHLALNAGH